jgi:hypothetical protein
VFDNSTAGQLKVGLTNTSLTDVLVPADVLTALFFSTSISLTPFSATLPSGSTVFYDADGQAVGGVVGGEWAYKTGLTGAPGGATSGISSSGFSGGVSFGSADRFPGADLESPAAPDGLQYGILSAGDNTLTGNTGVTGSGGLIKNAVDFILTLAVASDVFDLTTLTKVSFQYGTSLTEPNLSGGCDPSNPSCSGGGNTPPVPLPAAFWLFGSALAGLGLIGVRRRRRTPSSF